MHSYQGVSDTLFIPLTGRIYVSRRFPEYFYDAKAIELEPALPNDAILKNSPEYAMLAPAARYYNLDLITIKFIKQNELCNIVNLGCGLDTASFRIKEKRRAVFYEVDFPDVIAGRKKVLGEAADEVLVAGDILSFTWADRIDRSLPTLFIASGVFQYFHENDVLHFIREAKALFTNAELVFDATGSTGLAVANLYVRRTGNKSAMMYFSVKNGLEFAEKAGVTLLAQRDFYTDARRILRDTTKLLTRISMAVADWFNMAMLIHLKL